MKHRPEIMAPAGDAQSFLAALAAGADAIYVGLKHFSARMQAKNFSITELARLTALAHKRDARVYVTMNSLLKPGDDEAAGRLIDRVARVVKPDALIIQDLGMARLAREAGFQGELHLSTLGNCTSPTGLAAAREFGFDRVVLPRELNLDEVRQMADACPDNLALEIFVHGALCFCVSGRCYWSSSLGGKSSLRGRCVQPCRRLYRQGGRNGNPGRHFSCMDLGLDVLTKPLLAIPKVGSWKIEGRKKGPHYVFYAVRAYRLLRDEADNAESRKAAMSLIEQALGRPTTHSTFLPQRPYQPVQAGRDTASGLLVGLLKKTGPSKPAAGKGFKGAKNFKGGKDARGGKPAQTFSGGHYFQARQELLPGDLIRVGYEDDAWHQVIPIRRRIPKRGRVDVLFKGRQMPPRDASVFLIDRREPELTALLRDMERELVAIPEVAPVQSNFTPPPPPKMQATERTHLTVSRSAPHGRMPGEIGLWLEGRTLENVRGKMTGKVWWWLPPVLWPDEEDRFRRLLTETIKRGGRTFVCNAPWQLGLFHDVDERDRKRMRFVAGPFCNAANTHHLLTLRDAGFEAAFVSPELSGEEFLALPRISPLPLGIVFKGMWPLGIARFQPEGVKVETQLLSPKGETSWVRAIGQNHWIYADRELDLSAHQTELEKAGYSIFATLREFWPKFLRREGRITTLNWDLTLM